MFKYLNIKILVAWMLFLLNVFLFVRDASAAEIYFGAPTREVGLNDFVEVGVFINTETEDINAAEGEVNYSPNDFELSFIRDGGSIISLWVEKPEKTQDGKVFFSGIIPGGYSGSGYIFSLVLKTKKEGEAGLEAGNVKVLLNDGEGTETTVSVSPLVVNVVNKGLEAQYVEIKDSTPPEDFTLEINRDPVIWDGDWFIAWNAQDKESGISHYEVQETYATEPNPKNWVKAESPYKLKDQSLKRNVFVKAVDKVGLEKIALLKAAATPSLYDLYGVWIIIIIIALVNLVFFSMKKRRK